MIITKHAIPRIAAIHDLSGFGRSSLTVVIPILSAMGMQVCPLPTAVLSTHSKFNDFHFVDLTSQLEPMIAHWKALNLNFQAIYSGFLGSEKQVAIVEQFIRDFNTKNQLVVVDPVLGDNGKLYSPLNPEMVEEMKRLIKSADVITPNITEAALLLNKKFDPAVTEKEIQRQIVKLAAQGPRIVIVTSVPDLETKNRTAVIAYNQADKRFWKVSCDYLPASYPGTGDAFASVVTGSLLQGDSLPIALDRAVQFISMGVRATFGHDYNTDEGIILEKILPQLGAPVQMSSYQLLEREGYE